MANSGEGAHVEVTPMKSTLCCNMCACRAWSKEVEASRFLATTLWTEQKVTVGVPERDGRRNSPPTTSATIPPRVLAGGGFVDNGDSSIRLKRVLVEQQSKVCAASVRNELI